MFKKKVTAMGLVRLQAGAESNNKRIMFRVTYHEVKWVHSEEPCCVISVSGF